MSERLTPAADVPPLPPAPSDILDSQLSADATSPADKTAIESRSRMISFRVTAEEFDRFRKICADRGLRNVSEVS